MFIIAVKFFLICLLILCLLTVVISGLGLYTGIFASLTILNLHIFVGLVLTFLVFVHLIHRRRKLLKLLTQFIDLITKNKYPSFCNLDRLLMTFENLSLVHLANRLQLAPEQLLEELKAGKIIVTNPNQTLREIVGQNDEKLFSAITIIMRLKFPNLDIK